MRKLLIALGLAVAFSSVTLSVSAEKIWKYNDVLTIDLDETSYKKTTDGHEILEFVAVE